MKLIRGLPDHPLQPASALAIGNFDGVHLGHKAILDELKRAAKARKLTPGVLTFDPHPRQYFALKAGQPEHAPSTITHLRKKIAALMESGIDFAVLLRFDDAIANLPAPDFIRTILIDRLNVKWLIIGSEFRFGKNREGSTDDLVQAGRQYGFDVEVMPAVKTGEMRISSSAVRDALKENDFSTVKKLLGAPYCISGHVIHGDKRGHQLGFPTANLPLRAFTPILSGVYVTQVHGLAEHPLPAVSMIGTRPTIDETPRIVLETHILDYGQSLYGRLIDVEFLEKIRENRKFPDLNALRDAIQADALAARDWFSRHHSSSSPEKHNT